MTKFDPELFEISLTQMIKDIYFNRVLGKQRGVFFEPEFRQPLLYIVTHKSAPHLRPSN